MSKRSLLAIAVAGTHKRRMIHMCTKTYPRWSYQIQVRHETSNHVYAGYLEYPLSIITHMWRRDLDSPRAAYQVDSLSDKNLSISPRSLSLKTPGRITEDHGRPRATWPGDRAQPACLDPSATISAPVQPSRPTWSGI